MPSIKRTRVIGLFLALTTLPNAAFAFNFGFIRAPDQFDRPLLIALAMTLISFVLFKIVMPKGVSSYTDLPTDQRTPVIKLVTLVLLLSTLTFFAMLFFGMCMQRATEW